MTVEAPNYVQTDETITDAALRELYDCEPEDEPLEDVITCCDGEWRREGELFRWWKDGDL